MFESSSRLPVEPPDLQAPPPLKERRSTARRSDDLVASQETLLLARSLDILVEEAGAEARLADLLDLLARTVGAERAAIVADGNARRVVVGVGQDEEATRALALGQWLDSAAPRSRAERAAAGPAPLSVAVGSVRASARRPTGSLSYAQVAVPTAGHVTLGFAFASPDDAAEAASRLPRTLARHAAVALALVVDQLAAERELGLLRAREAERATFVSTVAHELRTPLTGLAGYLDLILDGSVDDPAVQREFMERGRGIVTTIADLVGDLLDLSRLESGALTLDCRPFSLADALGRVADGLDPIAMDRGIALETSLPPRLRAATGDRRRVEQILTNLAGNALKFTQAGSTVELAGWFDGSVALVAVRDEGDGIALDDRVRIFERFYRMAGHDRITGTGLGLPIARDLARTMGGDLAVSSVPGSGSSFVLALPGPTTVAPGVVTETLERTLPREDVALEERAVLRAIRLGA
jgi:signal transduction histidine kinase